MLKTSECLELLKAPNQLGLGPQQQRNRNSGVQQNTRRRGKNRKCHRGELPRYCSHANPAETISAEIGSYIERALPNPEPVRPNVPRDLAVGGLLGLLLALLAGAVAACSGFLLKNRQPVLLNLLACFVAALITFGLVAELCTCLAMLNVPMLNPLRSSIALAVEALVGSVLALAAGATAGWATFRFTEKHPALPRGFGHAFSIVLVSFCVIGILVIFTIPESFCSTARLKLGLKARNRSGMVEARGVSHLRDPRLLQTELELIQSELVLGNVMDRLDLNKVWAREYGGTLQLKTSETMMLLKRTMALSPVRDTSLIEIKVYGEEPEEASKLANAIAEAYLVLCGHPEPASSRSSTIHAGIFDKAIPSLAPVRPSSSLGFADSRAYPEPATSRPSAIHAEIIDKASPGLCPVQPK